jgi:hypothetical protein
MATPSRVVREIRISKWSDFESALQRVNTAGTIFRRFQLVAGFGVYDFQLEWHYTVKLVNLVGPDLTGQSLPSLPLYPEVLLSPHCSYFAP